MTHILQQPVFMCVHVGGLVPFHWHANGGQHGTLTYLKQFHMQKGVAHSHPRTERLDNDLKAPPHAES